VATTVSLSSDTSPSPPWDTANSINYATVATYAPWGALSGIKYGVTASFTGIVTSNSYNQRLQPSLISASSPTSGTLLSFFYTYGAGGTNNGNVLAITNNLDGVRPNRPNGSAQFTYDALNRITSARTPGVTPDCTVLQPSGLTRDWGQTFTIDAWGNLYDIATERCSTTAMHAGPNTANNRLNGLPGAQYDAAGNMTNDGTHGVITYDAENRIAIVAGASYTYDGDGERVAKSTGTRYWGLAENQPLAESDASGNIQARVRLLQRQAHRASRWHRPLAHHPLLLLRPPRLRLGRHQLNRRHRRRIRLLPVRRRARHHQRPRRPELQVHRQRTRRRKRAGLLWGEVHDEQPR